MAAGRWVQWRWIMFSVSSFAGVGPTSDLLRPSAELLPAQPGRMAEAGETAASDDARFHGRTRLCAPRAFVGFVSAQKVERAATFVDRSSQRTDHRQPTGIVGGRIRLDARRVVINGPTVNEVVFGADGPAIQFRPQQT